VASVEEALLSLARYTYPIVSSGGSRCQRRATQEADKRGTCGVGKLKIHKGEPSPAFPPPGRYLSRRSDWCIAGNAKASRRQYFKIAATHHELHGHA